MMIQGQRAHPPMREAKMVPRQMLKAFGNMVAISFANDIALTETLTEIWASSHRMAQKKATARPPAVLCHWLTMSSGFHSVLLYSIWEAAAETIPSASTSTLNVGITGSCQT